MGTRGALYHHFADKKALFVAVLEAVEEDLVIAASANVREAPPLEMLRNGLLGFLDASVTPEVQRILLISTVLPCSAGRSGDRSKSAMASGASRGCWNSPSSTVRSRSNQPPLQHTFFFFLATTDEAALFIANADDPVAARDQTVAALDHLLSGLSGQS